MIKKIIAVLAFIFLVTTIVIAGLISIINDSLSPISPVKSAEDKKTKVFPFSRSIDVFGWTAWWDEPITLESLKHGAKYLSGLSPTFYRIEPNGHLGRLKVDNREEVLALARDFNLPVTPVIGDDFDFARVQLLLDNPEVQEEFVQQLVNEAKQYKFSGWDLNIESLSKEDKEAFSNLIAKLADALHKNQLKLFVTVFARHEQEKFSSALAHDYQNIGRFADRVQIMLYGYYNDDTPPGAQAPLEWYRKVLTYAVERIPREKIVVGLSTHGYEWSDNSVESLTYPRIRERLNLNNAAVEYMENDSSAVSKYKRAGEEYVIWFEDARTISQKIKLAIDEFKIKKFIIWRIGAEDEQMWEMIEEIRSTRKVAT